MSAGKEHKEALELKLFGLHSGPIETVTLIRDGKERKEYELKRRGDQK